MHPDDLFWHDGNILSLALTGNPPRAASLTCSLYANMEAPQRAVVHLELSGVSRVVLTADIDEVADNTSAGSVVDGHVAVRNGDTILRVMVTGGYLEISCKEISIRAATDPSCGKRV